FAHLTFQEFFAAWHIAQVFLEPTQKTITEIIPWLLQEKFNPRYQIMLWFVAGLLKENPERLMLYLGILQDAGTRDLQGDMETALLARCYDESLTDATEKHLQPIYQRLEHALWGYYHQCLSRKKGDNLVPFNIKTKPLIHVLPFSPRLQQKLTSCAEHW